MVSRRNLFLRGDIYYFRKKAFDPAIGKTRRIAVSTGCKDIRQAARRKVELEKEANDGTFGWRKKRVEVMPVESWLRECIATYAKAMVGRSFTNAMSLGVEFWDSADGVHQVLPDVTEQDCAKFMNWLTARGMAKNTIRNRMGSMRLAWNHAIAAGHAKSNPWSTRRRAGMVKLPKEQNRKRYLKVEEQPALFSELKPLWQRLVKFDILTGLRHDELRQLKDEDIDFVLRQVLVRAGKGEKERYVPLSADAAVIAREQIAARDNGTMGVRLVAATRKRIAQGYIWPFGTNILRIVKEAAERAGLEPLTVHDLRRTFGTRCARSGVPMKTLQEWMGHSSITITAKFYVMTDPERDPELMKGLTDSLKNTEESTGKVSVATKMATVAKRA